MKVILFALVFLGPLVIPVPAQKVTDIFTTIRGQVVMAGGIPIPRFPIRFVGATGSFRMDLPAGIDSKGNFTAALPAGDYRITFTDSFPACCAPESLPPGYRVNSLVYDGVQLSNDQIHIQGSVAGKLVITLSAAVYKVSGRITGLRSGPERARIFLRPGLQSFLPGAVGDIHPDGSFELSKVVSGTYDLDIYPSTAGIEKRAVVVSDHDITDLNLSAPQLADVTGNVILEGGIPLPRFSLRFVGTPLRVAPYLRTDANGKFTVQIPETEASIVIGDLDPAYQVKAFTYGATDLLKAPLKIENGAPLQPMTITLAAAGRWARVSGRLLGAGTIQPIWRHVQLYGGPLYTVDVEPGSDGTFHFGQIPPGRYTVKVNMPSSMGSATTSAITVAGADVSVELKVTPVVQIVEKTVVSGGGPLPRYTLVMTDGPNPGPVVFQGSGILVPQGEYRIRVNDVTPGYTVSSIRAGSADLLKDAWKVSPATLDQLVVTFDVSSPPPWKRVSGRIIGDIPKSVAAPAPQGGVGAAGIGGGGPGGYVTGPERVTLYLGQRQDGPQFSSSFQATINPDGSFEFPQVLPGSYQIRLVPVFAVLQPATVTITNRDLTGLEFEIEK